MSLTMSLNKVLINGKEVQVETVKVPITKLGDEVILDRFFNTIKIDRYWDSYGQKVYDKESWPCETLKDKHIKIINQNKYVMMISIMMIGNYKLITSNGDL